MFVAAEIVFQGVVKTTINSCILHIILLTEIKLWKKVIYFKILKLSCIHILEIYCIYMAIHRHIAISLCTWLKINGAVSILSYCAYFLRKIGQNTARSYETSICKKNTVTVLNLLPGNCL